MDEEQWAGVDLKIRHANFFLEQMSRALAPPDRTAINVALESSGTILDTRWQESFYAHFDAFLAMARSVPEIIKFCFGEDEVMALGDSDERKRRREFSYRFKVAYSRFRGLPLSVARNVSLHRSGVAPVVVKIEGRFGITYDGTPVRRVPTSEIRELEDPEFQWLVRPVPLRPGWQDFEIDGRSLFAECRLYIEEAARLIEEARQIAQEVHGDHALTPAALADC